MITIGQTYQLEVIKIVDFGVYLDADNLGEVLLPVKYEPDDLSIGDLLKVFLYLDAEQRPVATTQTPYACVGEFAYLKVIDNTNVGAFLDWGLDKDLLVPFGEQHKPMEVDHHYLVYIYVGDSDGRITASSKIDKFLDDEKPHDFTTLQTVDLIIANSTTLGFKAIVNHSHWGVLYENEVFQRLSFGQSIKGYIKHIRDDGKLDLSLQGGKQTRDEYSEQILQYLKNQNGFAPVHDRTDPQAISELFNMSKKSFKKTIGGLYKQRIIRIEKDGIYLIK